MRNSSLRSELGFVLAVTHLVAKAAKFVGNFVKLVGMGSVLHFSMSFKNSLSVIILCLANCDERSESRED